MCVCVCPCLALSRWNLRQERECVCVCVCVCVHAWPCPGGISGKSVCVCVWVSLPAYDSHISLSRSGCHSSLCLSPSLFPPPPLSVSHMPCLCILSVLPRAHGALKFMCQPGCNFNILSLPRYGSVTILNSSLAYMCVHMHAKAVGGGVLRSTSAARDCVHVHVCVCMYVCIFMNVCVRVGIHVPMCVDVWIMCCACTACACGRLSLSLSLSLSLCVCVCVCVCVRERERDTRRVGVREPPCISCNICIAFPAGPPLQNMHSIFSLITPPYHRHLAGKWVRDLLFLLTTIAPSYM